MKFYKIDAHVIISDETLTVGEELVANTTDAAGEKHVPVIEITSSKLMKRFLGILFCRKF